MDAFLAGLIRPLLFLLLWVGVVYWIKLLLWRLIPDGKVKRFLFKRRGQ